MNLKHAVRTLLVGVAALACAPLYAQEKEAAQFLEANRNLVTARATIQGCTNPNISGLAFLVERPSAEGVKLVDIVVFVRGMAPGKHAIHIHATGMCTPCAAAGGHFDPGPNGNPVPDGNHPFHSGDLINVQVSSDGLGTMTTTTSRVTLSPGPLSIFDADGSALIIHDLEDTYCPSGPSPNCAGGTRAACGVIIQNP